MSKQKYPVIIMGLIMTKTFGWRANVHGCLPGNTARFQHVSLAAFVVASVFAAGSISAQAATFATDYKFLGGNDGASPHGGLVADGDGVLYGTTANGGPTFAGTVYSLTKKPAGGWTHKVIYTFKGAPDGAGPSVGLTVDPASGALFGVTQNGGASAAGIMENGIVFKLTPNPMKTKWTETVIHRFKFSDGSHPTGRLLLDKDGALYGMAQFGGTKSFGTVFSLKPNPAGTAYKFTLLHSFAGGAEGGKPNGGLIFDTVGGALLGTTGFEGTKTGQCSQDSRGCGTVFRITKSGTFKSIYRFKGANDGMEPTGELVLLGNNLYGATRRGGTKFQGSVFKLKPSNAVHTVWTESLIYSFKAGNDGKGPMGVTARPNGQLYGATEGGGAAGEGTLFKLTPPLSGDVWTETVLHRFTGGADGGEPQGTLLLEGAKFYGTTSVGGGASGSGSVFETTP
jgi:uncharacterized repeat protein (TIGR03803 family)